MVAKQPCHHRLKKEECLSFFTKWGVGNWLFFHGEEYTFYPCIIYFGKVAKYPQNGYQGFLTSVEKSNMEHQEADPSSLKMVKE